MNLSVELINYILEYNTNEQNPWYYNVCEKTNNLVKKTNKKIIEKLLKFKIENPPTILEELHINASLPNFKYAILNTVKKNKYEVYYYYEIVREMYNYEYNNYLVANFKWFDEKIDNKIYGCFDLHNSYFISINSLNNEQTKYELEHDLINTLDDIYEHVFEIYYPVEVEDYYSYDFDDFDDY